MLPDDRLHVAADQVEQGRFAGAVRADQRVALALRDGQIDVADHLGDAEGLLDAAQFDGVRSCGDSLFARRGEGLVPGVRDPGPGLARHQESADQQHRRDRPDDRARRIERTPNALMWDSRRD